jgi:CheY-like chemotaxis protein/HPt (histidine-containing phosphotransfer) domain-containing protein
MVSYDWQPSEHADGVSRERSLAVLLVEDCAVNALLATTFLRQLGHTTTRVANGREAIELFSDSDFDVVLLDLELPEIDGFEVAETIRANATGGKRVPIIAVTALADVERVQRLQSSGFDGYLEKPLRLPVLENALNRMLRAVPPEPVGLPHAHTGLDREDLLRELDGDAGLLVRMVEIFRDQSIEQLEVLRQAMSRKDAAAVGAAAHALKGGIANFERAGAYTSAARLESLAATASLEDAPAEYSRLLGELRTLARDLSVLESSLVETALEDS